MFTSDFRIVADYFVQMRKNRDYTPPQTTIRHVHELLQLMSVMTKDERFEHVYSPEMERGTTNMCEVLDRIENRGIALGISQGISQGISHGISQGIRKGTDQMALLVKILIENNRMEDLKRAAEDGAYRSQLLEELLPQDEEL